MNPNNDTEFTQKINQAVSAAFSDLKEDLLNEITTSRKRSAAELTEKVTKKVKDSTVPDFKRKYNKIQYEHNNKVKQALLAVEEAHIEGDEGLFAEKMEEGKNLLDKRMKVIRIADRESDGWEVAKCYLSDTLADNSDDEKRIVRSRKQAAANKKQKYDYYKRKRTVDSYKTRKYLNYKSESYDYEKQYRRNNNSSFRNCYLCGEQGHYYAACPRNKPRGTN